MYDADEGRWGEEDFTWEALAERSRNGSFPVGFLEAYGAHQRKLRAAIHREIESLMAKAASSAVWTFD